MFHHARLKLTAWYLLIIMIISTLFSVAFYHTSTREIERIINRIEFRQRSPDMPMPERIPSSFTIRTQPSLIELENSKKEIFIILLLINGAIFIFAGGAAYFLAGRTLQPIKLMIDEQNQFISSASHELRTPIATMRAEMEGNLLEKQISDKKARELITSNLEELTTLQDLSNNLLQIAKIHNSKQEKYMETISLLEIIKTAQKKIMPLAKKKQITITVVIKDIAIVGETNSLTEVFVILFDNAIKYSSEKSHIIVSDKENKNMISIVVTDEGVGIAKEDLPYIFDRFYRADKSRSEVEGYGLGLSLAKAIVEKHNGSIIVESTENKGTIFIVSLPLKTS